VETSKRGFEEYNISPRHSFHSSEALMDEFVLLIQHEVISSMVERSKSDSWKSISEQKKDKSS